MLARSRDIRLVAMRGEPGERAHRGRQGQRRAKTDAIDGNAGDQRAEELDTENPRRRRPHPLRRQRPEAVLPARRSCALPSVSASASQPSATGTVARRYRRELGAGASQQVEEPSEQCVAAAEDDAVDQVLRLVLLFAIDDGEQHFARGIRDREVRGALQRLEGDHEEQQRDSPRARRSRSRTRAAGTRPPGRRRSASSGGRWRRTG